MKHATDEVTATITAVSPMAPSSLTPSAAAPTAAVESATPFGVAALPSFDKNDRPLLVVCAQGRFSIPPAAHSGAARDVTPKLCPEQSPPVFEDSYWGEPATSSLRWEGQSAYRRPATDVYLTGHAWTPQGNPARLVVVEMRVGELLHKRVLVVGERHWEARDGKLVASRRQPFTSLPLRYEECFGGRFVAGDNDITEACKRNPVGRGAYASFDAALGQPLPTIEDMNQRVHAWTDQPKPACFGPIARHWAPRLSYAGTYDETWREQRAPSFPNDFDERFFCAAAEGMSISEPQGGEIVTVSGVSPDGGFCFALPQVQLEVTRPSPRGTEHTRLTLDGVHIDTDERLLTLIWRATINTPHGTDGWDECNVRFVS